MPKRVMPVKTVPVTFEGTDYEGFTCRRRINAHIGTNRRFWDMGLETPTEEVAEIILELFPSWDINDEDGNPIPHTLAGFLAIPKELLDLMNVRGLAAFKEAVMPDPLDSESSAPPSDDGKESPSPKTS